LKSGEDLHAGCLRPCDSGERFDEGLGAGDWENEGSKISDKKREEGGFKSSEGFGIVIPGRLRSSSPLKAIFFWVVLKAYRLLL